MDPRWTAPSPEQQWLQKMLYEKASRPGPFDNIEIPRMTRWNRLKYTLNAWLPRVHLGPCDHEGCE